MAGIDAQARLARHRSRVVSLSVPRPCCSARYSRSVSASVRAAIRPHSGFAA